MKRRNAVKTSLMLPAIFLTGPFFSEIGKAESGGDRLLMIYNNIGHNKDTINEWGLSVWIEGSGHAVLFDTGGDPQVLEKNISSAGIDPEKLSKIVISHNHWDHVNGLQLILEKTRYRPEVYVPAADLGNFRDKYPQARLIGVEGHVKIDDSIWSTGQLPMNYRDQVLNEQSIIIKGSDQLILLTGCAHPGIVAIVRKAGELFPRKHFSLVAGGFHLGAMDEETLKEISSELKSLGVEKLAPSHCTGEKAIQFFREEWGDRFVNFNNGDILIR